MVLAYLVYRRSIIFLNTFKIDYFVDIHYFLGLISPLTLLDMSCRYKGCEPLTLSCPNCSGAFDCPTVFSSICSSINEKPTVPQDGLSTSNFWCKLRCPKCPAEGDSGRVSPALIANQVICHKFSRKLIY